MKRFLSLVLTLCLIVGLLPAVAFPKAQAAVETATLTVFGTSTTINAGESLYWVNGVGTAKPVEATATDAWNYSLAIVDGEVVFTMRNAEYSYTGASFLYAKMDGNLRVNYEGVNNINISKTVSNKYYFLKHLAVSTSAGKANLYLQGGDDDVLNVSGGGQSTGLLHTNKSKLYITGGTVNLEKTAGANYPVIYCHYIGMEVKNCNLNVTQLGTTGNTYPTIYGAYNATNHQFIIQDSNVTVKGPNTVGICAGVFLSSLKGTEATANLYIKGKSDVKIELNTPDANLNGTYKSYRYMGSGIYCKGLYIQGGSLEVTSRKHAINFTADATTPDLSGYTTDYSYEMFTAKDGEAVTEYTRTGYFKLAAILPCEHKNTTTSEAVTLEPTCGAAGIKTFTVTCSDCGEVADTWEVALPATNEHNYDAVTGVCSGCGDVEIPIEGPTWPEDVTFATAEQMANVVVEKKASAGGAVTAHPGGRITYKISITNNNAEAVNVHIEDLIPKDTTLVSGCDYTSGRALYWVAENIAPGETRVITYNVKPDFTIAEVRDSAFDIILTNNDAKVMDVTVPATEDIWVLETFNAEDIRKLEMAIDALVTANQSKLSGIKLLNMMFNVGFTAGPGLGTSDPDKVLEMIFEKAGENLGGSTGSGEDATDTALNLLDRVAPHLYGGTAVPAEKDELFRGARATEVTIDDLISGDLLFVKKDGETKFYLVDNSCLVYLGATEVIRKIDPATVLPGLTAAEQFVVIRPSINYNITFGLQEGEYFNDADKNGYTEVEKAIIATAEAFLLRGDRAQYTDDMTGTGQFRWESGIKQPEDYTVDQYGYTNCAAFTYDANYMTTGYKAVNGDNQTLNTTDKNAAFAKKYWDATTGTSTRAGVVYYAEPMKKDASGTYVCTLTEEEKAAMKAEIISLLRPGDIINIRRTTGSGHAMLYAGNGTIIHSGGSSYSNTNKTDTHEATVRFRMVEDLFDPSIYAETSCVYYLVSFSILRPAAMTTKGASQQALNRMNNMQGIIGEKIASTAMGKTVSCGDEITYTFYAFNTNNEDKVITINDVLSQYVTFVSATDNAVVDGSNISWNITVPADTRISVSYTVKVNEGVAQFTAIDGSKATINGVAHKCIDTYVANTLTEAEQQTVLDAVNTVKEMDVTGLNNMQIAELIYKEAFGIEHIFGGKVTNGRELLGGDTDNDYSTKGKDNWGVYNDAWYWESSNKTTVAWMPNHNTSAAAQMVAPGMFGGQLVMNSTYNKNGRDERSDRYLNVADGVLRSRYFWEKDLVIGDIFMMGSSSNVYLYIYVGNDTFILLNNFATYSVAERFEYAPHTTWKYLAVMRPSFVFEEAHNVVDIPAVDATCDAAGKTAGKECADCGVHLVEPLDVPVLGHTEEIIPGKDATCTENGLTEGKKCTVCGEILVEQTEIPALGEHTEEIIPGKAATCTETGLTEGKKCSVCGEILVAQEEIPELGHDWIVVPGKDATCTETGLTEGEKCELCGEVSIEQEVIDALGHSFDNADDADCSNCDYTRPVAGDLTLDESNKLVFADDNAENLYHRVVVYYLGEKTVSDITLTNPLKAIDPNAKTYWGIGEINKVQLLESGNYVVHLFYNTAGSAKIKVAKQFTVEANEPTLTAQGGKLNVVDEDASHIYHRAVVYYLGDQTVEDIYDEAALQAIDSTAKTYWGLGRINNVRLQESGNYVVLLHYNYAGSSKLTVAMEVTY